MPFATLFLPTQLAEKDVARVLEGEFEAAWFPERHRCSIDTTDGVVYVDFDRASSSYLSSLSSDEQCALVAELGFVPQTALHVETVSHYEGSSRLAEIVLETLRHEFNVHAVAK